MTMSKLTLAGAVLLSSAFAVQAAPLSDPELAQFNQPAYATVHSCTDFYTTDAMDARAEVVATPRNVRILPAPRVERSYVVQSPQVDVQDPIW